MPAVRKICWRGLHLTYLMNDKSRLATSEMTPAWMVGVSYVLWKLGIRQWRTVKFTFEYDGGLARTVK